MRKVSLVCVLASIALIMTLFTGCPDPDILPNNFNTLSAPSGIATVALSAVAVRITWSDNSDDEQGFSIERSTSSTSGFTEIAAVEENETSYEDYSLDVSTRYYFRVRAFTSTKNSDYSDVASVMTDAPAYAGFSFELAQGDFWDYRWDSWMKFDGYYTRYDRGAVRVELGNAASFGGHDGFEVLIYASTEGFPDIQWTYLGTEDNRLIGSIDGASWEVIFDGNTGYWAGGGFFGKKPLTMISSAGAGSINNDYISGSAIVIGGSNSSSDCTYVPGYGTVCGGSGEYENFSKYEYFREHVGPVGYSFFYSYFDWDYSSQSEDNIGLIASSLRGDERVIVAEIEPNEYSTTDGSQVIELNQIIVGDIQEDDESSTILIGTAGAPNSRIVQDAYIFYQDTSVSEYEVSLIYLDQDSGDEPSLNLSLAYKGSIVSWNAGTTSDAVWSKLTLTFAPIDGPPYYIIGVNSGSVPSRITYMISVTEREE